MATTIPRYGTQISKKRKWFHPPPGSTWQLEREKADRRRAERARLAARTPQQVLDDDTARHHALKKVKPVRIGDRKPAASGLTERLRINRLRKSANKPPQRPRVYGRGYPLVRVTGPRSR